MSGMKFTSYSSFYVGLCGHCSNQLGQRMTPISGYFDLALASIDLRAAPSRWIGSRSITDWCQLTYNV